MVALVVALLWGVTAQPSLKGNTGVIEGGVQFTPQATKDALSIRVGVQGYVGKREGVSGEIRVRYLF